MQTLCISLAHNVHLFKSTCVHLGSVDSGCTDQVSNAVALLQPAQHESLRHIVCYHNPRLLSMSSSEFVLDDFRSYYVGPLLYSSLLL